MLWNIIGAGLFNLDHFRVGFSEWKLIGAHGNFYRVAYGCNLTGMDFNAFGSGTPTYIVLHFNAFGSSTPSYIVPHSNVFGSGTPNTNFDTLNMINILQASDFV